METVDKVISVSGTGALTHEVVFFVMVVVGGCGVSTTFEAVDEVVSVAGALTQEVVFLVVVVAEGELLTPTSGADGTEVHVVLLVVVVVVDGTCDTSVTTALEALDVDGLSTAGIVFHEVVLVVVVVVDGDDAGTDTLETTG